MLRTEDLGDVPLGITLHDLVRMVKAEGWDPKQVQISATVENWDYPVLEVTRQWDDGMLPPVPRPFAPAPTEQVQMNPDLVDLPDPMDMDPPRGAQGPTAPSRPATEPERRSLLRRAMDWRKR